MEMWTSAARNAAPAALPRSLKCYAGALLFGGKARKTDRAKSSVSRIGTKRQAMHGPSIWIATRTKLRSASNLKSVSELLNCRRREEKTSSAVVMLATLKPLL